MPPIASFATAAGVRPFSTATLNGSDGPSCSSDSCERVGQQHLVERRIDRRRREQLQLERRKLRVVEAVEPLGIRLGLLLDVAHERAASAGQARSAQLLKAVRLVEAAIDPLGGRDRVPGAAIRGLPLAIGVDLGAEVAAPRSASSRKSVASLRPWDSPV